MWCGEGEEARRKGKNTVAWHGGGGGGGGGGDRTPEAGEGK